jgi:hypothetical protein
MDPKKKKDKTSVYMTTLQWNTAASSKRTVTLVLPLQTCQQLREHHSVLAASNRRKRERIKPCGRAPKCMGMGRW